MFNGFPEQSYSTYEHDEDSYNNLQEFLDDYKIESIFDIRKGELDGGEIDELVEVVKDSNYFDQIYFQYLSKVPLDDWSVEEKESLLRLENVIQRHEEPTEEDIEEIFSEYRMKKQGYFLWAEVADSKNFLGKRNNLIGDLYAVIPLDLVGKPVEVIEQERRNYSFVRSSKDKGIVYSISGEVDSFFDLSDETERDLAEHESITGTIDRRLLKTIAARLKKFLESGSFEKDFSFLLQFYDLYDEGLQKEILNKLNLQEKDIIRSEKGSSLSRSAYENEFEKRKPHYLNRFDQVDLDSAVQSILEKINQRIESKKEYLNEKVGHCLERNVISVMLDCFDRP